MSGSTRYRLIALALIVLAAVTALAELHRARAIDSSYPDLASIADLMARWLRDPTISAQEMGLAERSARGRGQSGPHP